MTLYDDETDHLDELDPEGPSADDIERFDRDTEGCPSCGTEVYDEATVCPVCGELLTGETNKTKPLTIIVVVIVLAAFVLILL
ncbi:MAG: zinc-ribbon domain-containing protein [Planctomycetota bacterium]